MNGGNLLTIISVIISLVFVMSSSIGANVRNLHYEKIECIVT